MLVEPATPRAPAGGLTVFVSSPRNIAKLSAGQEYQTEGFRHFAAKHRPSDHGETCVEISRYAVGTQPIYQSGAHERCLKGAFQP
jgi:hypothetical protein